MSVASRKEIGRAVDTALMLKLRREGYPIEHIAGVVSMSPLACLAAINDALKELQGDSREYASQVREIELQRLDLATKAIMEKVEAGSHADIDMLLKLQKRRSAYLGLDAPVSANTHVSGVVTIDAPWMSPQRLSYIDAVPAPAIDSTTHTPWREAQPEPQPLVSAHRILPPTAADPNPSDRSR